MIADTSVLAAKIILINPISQAIQDIRYFLITNQTVTSWNFISSPFIKIIPILLVLVILIWGALYFRKKSKFFAEEV